MTTLVSEDLDMRPVDLATGIYPFPLSWREEPRANDYDGLPCDTEPREDDEQDE